MIVGFTGTREGMSPNQRFELAEGLVAIGARELHHGDCVGADAQAHVIARQLGLRVVGHPPRLSALRAFCVCDELMEPRPYLRRNREIVASVELLVAAPRTMTRTRGATSGTWYTVNHAENCRLPCVVLLRD